MKEKYINFQKWKNIVIFKLTVDPQEVLQNIFKQSNIESINKAIIRSLYGFTKKKYLKHNQRLLVTLSREFTKIS